MSSLPADVLPLNSEQTDRLQSAVSGLSPEQLQWVSGYVAGLAASGRSPALVSSVGAASVAPTTNDANTLTVLVGSQTGNGEEIAEALVKKAKAEGFNAEAISLADYKPAKLKRESLVTFVVSTHGEGDPPDDAEIFHEFLLSGKAPKLDGLKYSVLALGDSSYVNFCQTGREFDARLQALGAERFENIVECDLDYDDAVNGWYERVVAGLPELLGSGAAATPVLRAVEQTSAFDKSNPFHAEVLVNQKITGSSSSKDVRHIELSLEGSGLSYEPGDSLAVIVDNPPQLVEQILAALDLDGTTPVQIKGDTVELADALHKKLEITAVNVGFLRAWAAIAGDEYLMSLFEEGNAGKLASLMETHQIVDVVRRFPAAVGAARFVEMLRRLSPRSYSISSSLAANTDEVHITVAAVRYDAFGSQHWGTASTHLADRLSVGDKVAVFIERNKRFRLPQPDVPVIMIGPGTGVAPFRAFVEERVEQCASGENWLIFGDRNARSDFLYQLEWQRHLKQGSLQRLDVAFSRDQRKKVYVQDRIRDNSAELFRWVENGAVLYVCGDAKHMAGDVDDALLDVFMQHGGLDADAASEKMKELRSARRYQRDVY